MATYRCRRLGDDAVLDVEATEATFAPDVFVYENVRCDVPMGDEGVVFVEVADTSGPCPEADGWQCWRVAIRCVPGPLPIMLLTAPVTRADAQREIAEWEKGAS